MTKTENYQLPQWEASDPVRRGDVNDALLAIDGGMGKLERLLLLAQDRGRDQYRLAVQQTLCHGPAGAADSMWFNALTTREDAGGDGHGWNGRYGVCLGPGALPTIEGIQATIQDVKSIGTVPSHTEGNQAMMTFTSDGSGIMATMGVYSITSLDYTSQEYQFTITLTRTDTGEQVGQAGPFTSISQNLSNSTNMFTAREVNFPLETGVSYQMEFSLPSEHQFVGFAGLALVNQSTEEPLASFVQAGSAGTTTHTVPGPDNATGAVGVVRWQGDGGVSLFLNETELTPTRTRAGVNADGEACQETEFRTDALPEGDLTVTLQMTPNGGTLTVFDYGLIWT